MGEIIAQDVYYHIIAVIADSFEIGQDVDIESGFRFRTGSILDPIDVFFTILFDFFVKHVFPDIDISCQKFVFIDISLKCVF